MYLYFQESISSFKKIIIYIIVREGEREKDRIQMKKKKREK